MAEPLAPALADIRSLLLDPEGLVRAVASGAARGSEPKWRRVELRPVELKAGRRLQVVAYDERQAHTSNHAYGPAAEAAVDGLMAEGFGNWHVESAKGTTQLRVTKKGEAQVHRDSKPVEAKPALAHNREKNRLLDPKDRFWQVLGLADASGAIKPSRQDKYRQVEAFVQALDAALKPDKLPADRPLRVVDLGCGNAYLTFAAYRFLTATRCLTVQMVGVDSKAQARERNTALAAQLGWDGLSFIEGSIAEAPVEGADVVLALHACDTATDDALARAVAWKAPFVLAAPCCHHDLQAQLKDQPPPPAYAMLTRHGILRERFADVLTDALRANLLRQAGYRTEVVEFVGSQHTPRNTLLRATRTGAAPDPKQVAEYEELVKSWNVRPKLADLLATQPAF
ncbi:SAM-dependent methyltransferase [Aerophototrophica crusticola]|uniref:SAM-dependent methyltransferase n=1 Tax=Aerophototrophica crusticola TaxID=1709002 RepID=A0A858R6L7_9PROT|nr:SAM-dependent methyltransferase [Rhodospirillaceae bacterium B3]